MNLSCPVCQEIFKDPVFLSCSHNFCKACLQRWWTEKPSHECPLCRRRSSQSDPPRNLGLKNQCEAFLRERARVRSLHAENPRLFCLDQQTEAQTNNSIRRVAEAGQDYSDGHRELLKPLQEKLELFSDYKGNFVQTAANIEVQAEDTERQIKDVYLMLKNFLKREERARITALRKEKKQKSEMIKKKIEALSRDVEALSDTIRTTEDVLRAEDVSFQERYGIAAEIAHFSPPNDPQPVTGAAIDMEKHLNNLAFDMLDKVKEKVISSSQNPRTSDPDPSVVSLGRYLSRLRVGQRQNSSGLPETSRYFDTHQHSAFLYGAASDSESDSDYFLNH
ncbi:E3 ubiquitin-protein ligase TRIM35-like [Thunnus thynnus]|uniref:E3 ubiquitin-protein ligase TRIM35-like n=1 Tax=Thunnus thynnus TaxID=8237 RepID=UPI00352988EF